MSELVVTGEELFIIVTDYDEERAKRHGYSQFAIGPLEDSMVETIRTTKLDHAGRWLRNFNGGYFGPDYKALLVVGAVAKSMFPAALEKLAKDNAEKKDKQEVDPSKDCFLISFKPNPQKD